MREKNAGSANPTCAAVSATEAVLLERISCAFDILYLMMYSFGERPVLRLKSSKKRDRPYPMYSTSAEIETLCA